MRDITIPSDEIFGGRTDDGMRIVLTKVNGQIKVSLAEDFLRSDESKENKLTYLIGILEALTEITDRKESRTISGDEKKESVNVELTIGRIDKFEKLPKTLLGEIRLYRNLQSTLQTVIKQLSALSISKLPETSANKDIEFFVHSLEGRRIMESLKDLTPVAYFLRELYALIELKTSITREQIISNSKISEIVRERSIVIYLLKKKFPFLSLNQTGAMVGENGVPKNHATVINALNRFGRKPIGTGQSKDISYLYEAVKRKYNSVKKSSKNKIIPEKV